MVGHTYDGIGIKQIGVVDQRSRKALWRTRETQNQVKLDSSWRQCQRSYSEARLISILLFGMHFAPGVIPNDLDLEEGRVLQTPLWPQYLDQFFKREIL